ncbi:hypothetical protein CAOG_07002 [Capsaspora owczarzaki ATCC 30864]|uniref:Uncharacterized protein n=1 Tax=Capsaspora owczarzaki (strain ATCC 30864) TaxID=595528 RepID=A0A0D2VYD2_CAPO3|nr:hypothetical protein CAOG_07002 [Capsaspora owczarzaki ATCC 30864]KJE96727.1 hypothetical protein CAOG_007002 [Capsaspora owczarzaki ATCC 30864]|eukprot:XP_004343726.1 hypothetical protein CAOG_07002 [Capsaspora owczarzaki ATCC 30864]
MPKVKRERFVCAPDDEVAQAMGFASHAKVPLHALWRPFGRTGAQANVSKTASNVTGNANCFPRLTDADLKPGFDLYEDPEHPPQTLKEFKTDSDRRDVGPKANTIYVVGVGEAESSVPVAAIAQYVEAFYHGIKVTVLPMLPLRSWNDVEDEPKRKATTKGKGKSGSLSPLGVEVSGSLVRVRARASPDGVGVRQVNLNDMIDGLLARMETLKNAYAILGVTSEDLFEGNDDLFTMGRSYGGSGVALISLARDNPALDDVAGDPAAREWSFAGPVSNTPSATSSPASNTNSIWLYRACCTAVHELGHCLGMDHCIYFHCFMQGSASLLEARSQPPYPCPLELVKMSAALKWAPEHLRQREEALRAVLASLSFSRAPGAISHLAWLTARRQEQEAKEKEVVELV